MSSTVGRAYILVDADNVSSPRESVAEAVVCHAHADGLAVSAVHVVGRSRSVLSDYVGFFRVLSPTARITAEQAPPGRNSGDLLAALWFGKVSEQVCEYRATYRMYVLSRDNLVIGAARRALGERALVVPADASPKHVELLRTFAIPSSRHQDATGVIVRPALPAWAIEPSDPQNCVGLEVLGVAASRIDATPSFVPFPARLASVSIGSAAGGHVDIDLSAWDAPAPRRSLYSPHVVFEYFATPLSSWTVRSTHGHRTGRRRVALEGRLVNAEKGREVIRTGSLIDIGQFSFRFRDNTVLNHAWFEDPKGIIERCERGFSTLAENVPLGYIPEKVRRDLSDGTRVLWENAFIRNYEQLFAGIVGKSIVGWVDAAFRSKNEVRRDLGSLNRIRNVLFHPSRGAIADEDRAKLAVLYLRFRTTAGWPTEITA